MRKAIFLDRDGTINEDIDYLTRIQDIKIFPNTVNALQKFKSLGFLNIIVTNQSGIARGYLSENELKKIQDNLQKNAVCVSESFLCVGGNPYGPPLLAIAEEILELEKELGEKK